MYAPDELTVAEGNFLRMECTPGYYIDPQWANYAVNDEEPESPIALDVVRDR